MLKIFISVVIFWFVFICNANSQRNKHFVLNGEIKEVPDGTRLYLIRNADNDTIGYSNLVSGKFKIEGSVDNGTEYYYLQLDSSISNRNSSDFLLINGNQNLIGTKKSWPKITLTGSQPHNEYLEVIQLWRSYEDSIVNLELQESKASVELRNPKVNNDPVRLCEQRTVIREIANKRATVKINMLSAIKKYIFDHPNSLYIPDLINRLGKEFDLNEKEKMYQSLSKVAKGSYFGHILKENLTLAESRKAINTGSVLTNFNVLTVDGVEIPIHDLIKKSKYTLIDFWASWCKPCRMEVPNLKIVYEKYKNLGFNIVGVAVSDKLNDWKKAILDDSTTWTQTNDISNTAEKQMDITSVPAFALVDQQGSLLAYYCSGSSITSFGPIIHGKYLDKTLEELLNSNTPKLNKKEKALAIGDQVPDFSLGKIVNHPILKTAKYSDFKNKLLILDFWSTWCSVCIAQFPKLKKIQDKFMDSVVILPVGFDANQLGAIEYYLTKTTGTTKELKLPTAIQNPDDTLLSKLFPFNGMPHEIWIDRNGRLIAITDHLAITEENIASVLRNKPIKLQTKRMASTINLKAPFLINNKINASGQLIFGSAFSGYIDSLTNNYIFSQQFDSTFLRLFDINRTVFDLYKLAYSDSISELLNNVGSKRILVPNRGKTFFEDWSIIQETNDWDNWKQAEFNENNLFCYELILPLHFTMKDAYKIMRDDLDRFFRIKSEVRRILVKCYALVRTKESNAKDFLPNSMPSKKNANSDYYIGIDCESLVDQLNYKIKTQSPIIDESNFKGKIDFPIPEFGSSIDSINKELSKYFLELKEVQRELDMIFLLQ